MSPNPSILKQAALTLGITLAVWLALSYPLPVRVTEAIPSHTRRPGATERAMIPGDHLQLLYHFWLTSDYIAGGTPWFHNLYEFNTGNDAERFRVTANFVPFSLIFAAGRAVSGPALGWNLAFVFSLWMGYWAAWRLARRFLPDEFGALVAALPALGLPYRWAALCDGSPTGFAMMWVPVLFWLTARFLLEERRGPAWALGASLLLCAFGDTQVFYLCALALPVWAAFLVLWNPWLQSVSWRAWMAGWLRRSPPVLLGLALSVAFMLYRNAPIRQSTMKSGRSLSEVAIYSPNPEGFTAWRDTQLANDLYVSWLTPLLLLALVGLGLWRLLNRRNGDWRRGAALLLLVATALGAALLATGTQAPDQGRVYELCRRVIPKFSSLRQPLKWMSLAVALVPVIAALVLAALRPIRLAWAAGLAICAAAFLVSGKVRPTLCTLDRANGAYAAVAEDCDKAGRDRRALAVPLWPGDNAWSSLYLHYNAAYRIKGVNGYSPLATWRYFMEVFRPLRSVNEGVLTEEQCTQLEAMGVRHLLLHEDAFPEKVSPWPVGVTLARLNSHPRLLRLAQDGPVHAFRVLPEPRGATAPPALPRFFLPTRHIGAEAGWPREIYDQLTADDTASGGRCVTLRPGERRLEFPVSQPAPAPGLRWMLRVKGDGLLRVTVHAGGRQVFAKGSTRPEDYLDYASLSPVEIPVSSPEWIWVAAPFDLPGAVPSRPVVEAVRGDCAVDDLYLAAGEEFRLAPGEALELPAADFFHAGHSTASGAVVFRPGRDPVDTVLYGPRVPLPRGEYLAEFIASEGAGALAWRQGRGGTTATVTVADDRPVSLELLYSGGEAARVERIRLQRKSEPAGGE